jgi:hypothetical protein
VWEFKMRRRETPPYLRKNSISQNWVWELKKRVERSHNMWGQPQKSLWERYTKIVWSR